MADATITKSLRYAKKRSIAVYKEGPYWLVLRHDTGSYQIQASVDGKRYRISASRDIKYAKRRLREFIAEVESGIKPAARQSNVEWSAVAAATYRRQKNAAKGRGIPFELTESIVFRLMANTNFRCAVSGVMFSKPALDKIEVDPWAPSIDRIDNREGYTPDNVRVVAAAANYAMNRWGYDMLLRLANGVVRNSKCVISEPGDSEYDIESRDYTATSGKAPINIEDVDIIRACQ